jgi:hypothetical protein
MRQVTHLRLLNDMTMLHWASDGGFIRVVEGLLEAKGSVDAYGQFSASPWTHVCTSANRDTWTLHNVSSSMVHHWT